MNAASQAAPPRAAKEAETPDGYCSYFSASIPEPFRILGLRLKPLSLGRYRLLKRFECAFVADGQASAEIGDLILGVLICSMRCDEFLEFYDSKQFMREIRKWGKRICPHPRLGKIPILGKWWRSRHSFDVIEKIQLFGRYVREGSMVPKYFDEGGDTLSSGAHWSHAVEVTLRGDLNWAVEEINEAPLTKALQDYFKYAENQGLVRLMTEEDVRQGELNAAVYEKLLAGTQPVSNN